MITKSITSLLSSDKHEGLIVHSDTNSGTEYGLMSHVSLISNDLSKLTTMVAANFQFTAIVMNNGIVYISDEFGIIHSQVEQDSTSPSANTRHHIYEDGLEIMFYHGRWESELARHQTIVSYDVNNGIFVACFSDNEVWMKQGGIWKHQFTSQEPVRVCKINKHGHTLVASDNAVMLFKDKQWHTLVIPDYKELPRIIFTSIWFDEQDPLVFFIASRNGFVLIGDIQSQSLVDLDLPIHTFYDICQYNQSLFFACAKYGINRWANANFTQTLTDQSYQLTILKNTLYVSTEENNLKPTIKALNLNNGKITNKVSIE